MYEMILRCAQEINTQIQRLQKDNIDKSIYSQTHLLKIVGTKKGINTDEQ